MKSRPVDSAVLLSLLFGAVSLAWSLLGLLFPSLGPYRGHFTPALLAEVGGHFLFGLAAGAATGRLLPALLTGLEAVLIDSDHLVSAAGFPIDARLSHSLPFILLSSLLVAWAGSRAFGLSRYGLAAVTLASFLTHLSFDIVAGDGSFPLFFPLSAGFYSLPYLAWPALEAGAVCLCFVARRSWARSVM
ncbi:MAG TPA: metal-dependent hydrolase [Nitrososphaerales archaeon]|nr:metal-dependent hydrolase [Nitrososphaerales archaeon]